MSKMKKIIIGAASLTVMAIMLISIICNMNNKTKKSNGCTGVGCAGCNGCKTQGGTNITTTYYQNKKEDLLKTLDNFQSMFNTELKKSNTEQEVQQITKETKEEFVRLLPQIPYIGGDDCILTENLEQSAVALAFYNVEKKHGKSVEEIGDIIDDSLINSLKKESSLYKRFVGLLSNYLGRGIIKKDAIDSQKREYPGGWVSTYIDGDGKSFDYGYDYSECGIVKFYKQQNASALMPYMCKVDFIYSDAYGQGLNRTETLADGCQKCNFRYKLVKNNKMDLIIISLIVIAIGIPVTIIVVVTRKIVRKFKLKRNKVHNNL
ncbi:MAG: L-2-amino-thiazoline-4-carboxylic acid hydrolase [Bacillota bacterium]|nr:L-2-amino-thiazoline-4-carboxylic acid hydrolase [Bacillota bacterium]